MLVLKKLSNKELRPFGWAQAEFEHVIMNTRKLNRKKMAYDWKSVFFTMETCTFHAGHEKCHSVPEKKGL